MRAIAKVFMLLAVMLVVNSCSKDKEDIGLTSDQLAGPAIKSMQVLPSVAVCGEVKSYQLFAGQTIPVGQLLVSNDGENLYVTYQMENGWLLAQTQLYVGPVSGLPLKAGKAPAPGSFPYSDSYNPYVEVATYTIPLSAIADECFYIAAHAVVVKDGMNETAWSSGTSFNTLFGSARWGWMSEYCVQTCEPPCVFNPVTADIIRKYYTEGSPAFNGVIGSVIVTKDDANQQYLASFQLLDNVSFTSLEYGVDTTGYWGFFNIKVTATALDGTVLFVSSQTPWDTNRTKEGLNKIVVAIPFTSVNVDCFNLDLYSATKLLFNGSITYDYENATFVYPRTVLSGTNSLITVCMCQ